MAIDNTHTKYLHGSDKKAWSNYKDALESQKKLENFMDGLSNGSELKEGEEYIVPVRPTKANNSKKSK